MLKPIPDELVEEDERLTQLVRDRRAYDHVDDMVRKYASKEYSEWYFDLQEYLKEADNKGVFL